MYKDSPYSHTKLIIALTYLVILIYLSTSFWYDFGVLMVSLAHIISSLPGSSSGSEGICTSFFSELLLLLTLLPFVIFSFTFFRFDCFFGLPSLPFSDWKTMWLAGYRAEKSNKFRIKFKEGYIQWGEYHNRIDEYCIKLTHQNVLEISLLFLFIE